MNPPTLDAVPPGRVIPAGPGSAPLPFLPASVGARLARLAAASFQGRETEIGRFVDLVGDPGLLPHVVCVTGPPGIGKSALMAAVRDRLQSTGLADVLLVDVHEFDRSPEGLRRIIVARATPWPRRGGDTPLLIVVDGFDTISVADRRRLRERFHTVSGPVLVAICERRPPADLLVAQVGWRALMEDLPVGPLQVDEAGALLAAHGMGGAASQALALEAMGNPLLTAVAGDVALREPDPRRWGDRMAEEATRLLAARLAQEGVDAHGFTLVETAALATCVNEEVLATMIGRDITDEFPQFIALSVVVERASGEYAVAEPFRALVARDVRRRRPRWCAEVGARTVRIAEVAPTFLDSRTSPSRERLHEVKAVLEFHREGSLHEPAHRAICRQMVGEAAAEQVGNLLSTIVRSVAESRAPRVSEAGRLLTYYYCDRVESIEAVAELMNLSRATAFRRLRLGIELVAERLPIG